MKNFETPLDTLTDPVRFNAGPFGLQCSYFTIKLPLDKVRIEYYDWETGNVIENRQLPTRWQAITDVVDSIRVRAYRKYKTYCELDIILLMDELNPKYQPYLDLNAYHDEGYLKHEPLQESGSYHN
jgi:hypothetical protein